MEDFHSIADVRNYASQVHPALNQLLAAVADFVAAARQANKAQDDETAAHGKIDAHNWKAQIEAAASEEEMLLILRAQYEEAAIAFQSRHLALRLGRRVQALRSNLLSHAIVVALIQHDAIEDSEPGAVDKRQLFKYSIVRAHELQISEHGGHAPPPPHVMEAHQAFALQKSAFGALARDLQNLELLGDLYYSKPVTKPPVSAPFYRPDDLRSCGFLPFPDGENLEPEWHKTLLSLFFATNQRVEKGAIVHEDLVGRIVEEGEHERRMVSTLVRNPVSEISEQLVRAKEERQSSRCRFWLGRRFLAANMELLEREIPAVVNALKEAVAAASALPGLGFDEELKQALVINNCLFIDCELRRWMRHVEVFREMITRGYSIARTAERVFEQGHVAIAPRFERARLDVMQQDKKP